MKKRVFGRRGDGRTVDAMTLESADAAVTVLSYGCTVQDWRVDAAGGSLPMVLGFPDFASYESFARSHGAIVGRVANRTAGASFELDGKTFHLTGNTGPDNVNHIHGGAIGLGKRLWDMEADGGAVRLHYASPDGEEGYPGAVDFAVLYRLDGPTLVCEMSGQPDRPTPVNLASHSYYNLGGGGTVLDHLLWIDAADYTPVDDDLIPLGSIRPVEGTHLDFTTPMSIEESDPDRLGIDNNYVLTPDRDRARPAAWARCPRTGLRLEVLTDQPGLQIFDAAKMVVGAPGHGGESYGHYAGMCFEAQHYPDSLHHPDWPSIIVTPEAPYFQRLAVKIARGD